VQCVVVCCIWLNCSALCCCFVAVCCSVLQCTAVQLVICIIYVWIYIYIHVCVETVQLVQCAAACCSVEQHIAVSCGVLQYVVACWSGLQRVASCGIAAMCCSVMQWIAAHHIRSQQSQNSASCSHFLLMLACCSMLQCVAAWCSVLQRATNVRSRADAVRVAANFLKCLRCSSALRHCDVLRLTVEFR